MCDWCAGWTGEQCETDVDECSLSVNSSEPLCRHDGVCVNTNGSYRCDCDNTGYTGMSSASLCCCFYWCSQMQINLKIYLLTPTNVAGVKHLCVCACVCLHDRTKMAATTITKLAMGYMSPGHPFDIRWKVQGYIVQNILKAIKWPVWVCTSVKCPPSSWGRVFSDLIFIVIWPASSATCNDIHVDIIKLGADIWEPTK